MTNSEVYGKVKIAMFSVETVLMLQSHNLTPEIREALIYAVEALRPVQEALEGGGSIE